VRELLWGQAGEHKDNLLPVAPVESVVILGLIVADEHGGDDDRLGEGFADATLVPRLQLVDATVLLPADSDLQRSGVDLSRGFRFGHGDPLLLLVW
jgi:hypothetical protein